MWREEYGGLEGGYLWEGVAVGGEEVFGGGCSLSREEVKIGAGRRLVLGGLVLGGLVLGEKEVKRWRDVAPLGDIG